MSDAGSASPLASRPPVRVDLESIERELSQYWKPLERDPVDAANKAREVDEVSMLTRACMSNLIVLRPDDAGAEALDAEIDEIVARHPARVLMLVGATSGADAGLEAEISSRCHLIGPHKQVCCEQVTLRAGGGAVDRLPSAARSLLIGDLPTSVWWTGGEPPPALRDTLYEVVSMSDEVIFSSGHWQDPAAASRWTRDRLEPVVGRDRLVVSDLAWSRGGRLRRLTARSLDPSVAPGALASVREVVIEHDADAGSKAWMMIAWLATRLGWTLTDAASKRGQPPSWRFDSPSGQVLAHTRVSDRKEHTIRTMSIDCRIGDLPATIRFAREGTSRIGVHVEGGDRASPPRVVAAPYPSRAALVAAALQDLEADPNLVAAVEKTSRMSAALAKRP